MEISRPSRLLFALSLGISCVLSAALAYAVLFAVPTVAAEFIDFGATVPLPTRACIRFAAFVRNGYLFFGPLLGAGFVAIFVFSKGVSGQLKPAR
jgi:type II secretory pathway component PulF